MPDADRNLLEASSNPRKLIDRLSSLLNDSAIERLELAFDNNVRALLDLAHEHYRFSVAHARSHWRQRVSRLYYAAYNARRAVNLHSSGHFSQEVSDHRKSKLPDDFPARQRYEERLGNLRNDRNLADYAHFAEEEDLLLEPSDSNQLVQDFLNDSIDYLNNRGLEYDASSSG